MSDGRLLPAKTQVGDYQIESLIGAGGMGEIYAAVHPIIGTEVAIKVLRLEVASNKVQIERLVQEAQAVNRIRHPGIVQVFTFGWLPDERPYLVMERLHGQSLDKRLLAIRR